MTNIICDLCKKPIPDAVRVFSWQKRYERYDTIKDKDICPDCLRKLDDEIHAELEQKDEFEFNNVKQTMEDKLESMGKWQPRHKNRLLGIKI